MKLQRSRMAMGMGICVTVLVMTLACATAEPAPTAVPPAQPSQPEAPTAAPAPTATLIPGAPTPIPARPTPTRVLPTATPVAMAMAQQGGVLRHPANLPPTGNLDAQKWTVAAMQLMLPLIYAELVDLSPVPDNEIVPDLAERWEISEDGSAITFIIRQAEFQDGTPVNAEAIKWNMDRIIDPETGAREGAVMRSAISSVDVLDERRVRINLNQPSRPFLALLAQRTGYIASPSAVAQHGEDFGRFPVGAGPFKLKGWVPGAHVEFEAFDGYWEEGEPYLDGIRIPSVPDSSVMLAMIRTGEADIMQRVSSTDIPLIENDPDLNIVAGTGQIHILGFNAKTAPFDNQALRQAVAYALDRPQILKVHYAGLGQPAYIPVAPDEWVFDPERQPYKRDLSQARAKLAEAGHPDGVTIPMSCRGTPTNIRFCEVVQAQLSEANINIDIKTIEPSSYWPSWRTYYQGERTVFGWTWWTRRADPHIALDFTYHSQGGFNSTTFEYSNPEVDSILGRAIGEYDRGATIELYNRLLDIVADAAVTLPIVYPNTHVVMRNNVNNFDITADAWYDVGGIWLDR